MSSAFQSFKPSKKDEFDFWRDIGMAEGIAMSEAVQQGFNSFVIQRIAEKANLTQKELQAVTHIPASTLKRRFKEKKFSPQESDVIYRLASLLKLATELFQDEEKAQEWIHKKVYGLNGKRPIDMVSTTVEFEEVKDLIGRIEHGVFS
ncbi:DUF2384 domain-containing protein [Vibrio sp. S4M6]|uniref:type II RES/Xre toxin-antitoxin system antitoxin n=1 Tax=Vibrio sinus TaxID=2946865 RepID=UPI002029F18C|nr:antitoxin Xre/MbcA/ParS toxin-binding domain-containing protein [Vibrio sinus]MCL9783250.1 DUF2384 domain-containing protein [Vibrio sinus]